MKTTGITTIDHAPQAFAEWLNELQEDLDWGDRARAYMLFREVLHTLRDFLTVDEAADLAAQLPVLVRGIFYEGWVPSRTPVHPRAKSDFLDRVAAPFRDRPLDDAEAAVESVFALLRRHVSSGEIDQVKRSLRKPLRAMWS